MTTSKAIWIVSLSLLASVIPIRAQETSNNEQCTTPDEKDGLCINLNQCVSIKNMLMKQSLSNDEKTYILNSRCGSKTKDIFICCPNLSLDKNSPLSFTEDITSYEKNCTTPKGESAICIKLQHCPVIMEVLKNISLSPEETDFLRNSQCGYTNGTALVCCTSPSTDTRYSQVSTEPQSDNKTDLEEKDNYGNCKTPKNESALCVKLQHCPVLIELLKKNPLSPEQRTFIRNSQCGYTNGTALVCCPPPSTGTRYSHVSTEPKSATDNKTDLNETTNYGNCKTPKGESALCTKLQHCPVIIDLLKKSPLSPEEVTFVRNSQCGYTNGTALVCCPNPNFETRSSQGSSVTQPGNYIFDSFSCSFFKGYFSAQKLNIRVEVKTATEEITNYGYCTTPKSESALCVRLDQCEVIQNLLKKFPLSPEDRSFIKNSQCGYTNGTTLVCCSGIQTSVEENVALPEPGTCGDANSDRIFGGNITQIDEYPWMALIEYLKYGTELGHHCGGSLINTRYVLTAAHCIDTLKDWKPVRVRLGEWNTSTDMDCVEDIRGWKDCADPHLDIGIDKAVPHESYNPRSNNKFNDIGLIRLSESVAYTDFIRPICLPLNENIKQINFEGTVMDIAGWGRIENGSRSDIKLKASVPILPLSRCERFFRSFKIQISETQICAGGEFGIDSCSGDSGGPLIGIHTTDKGHVYRFAYGIVSYGTMSCGVAPGVYTKVHKYMDWIVETMEKIESLSNP